MTGVGPAAGDERSTISGDSTRALATDRSADVAALADVDLTDLDRFAAGFPHDIFSALRAVAPVWWHEPTERTPDGEGFWVLARHADCSAAAADPTTFSSERGPGRAGGGTLLEDLPHGFASGVLLNMMDDPRHREIRRLVTPQVGPRALAAIEPELRQRARTIVADAVERGRCDFLIDVASELPLQAIALLLGVPQADRHRLIAWANATLDYDDRDLGQQSERSQRVAAEMADYADALIDDKRARPGDDMLSAVVMSELTDDAEARMFFHLLVAAGSETTRNSIAVGLAALLEHPDEYARLRGDPSMLPAATEEILRWASSTAYNRRTATRDTTLAGTNIRAGDKVTLWWASANRDAAVFPDPFRFDVGRDPNPHLAFGHGAHFCLGANLARLEIRLVFAELLARDLECELTGPIEWVRSNKHVGVRHMPVVFRGSRS